MKLLPIEHHLQKQILHKLVASPSLRFSVLKPHNIESNLFMYHLRQLIKRQLVEKIDDYYQLSRIGKQFVDRVNLATLEFRIQPKLITVLCVERRGMWLLLERTHQPFLGIKGFPSGKIHLTETLQQAAERELSEKAGIQASSLALRGNVIMRFVDSVDVINHVNAYIFYAKLDTSEATTNTTEYFRTYWAEPEKLLGELAFKGNKEIIELLHSHKDFFFRELEFASDY